MLVIFLAIFAPLALVLMVLPGAEKGYKLWWDSFFGALLLFPIIEGMIAMGAAFSRVVVTSNVGGNVLSQIIGFAAVYIPFFILPMTVRFAGGALRNIGGSVHQGSQGLRGGLQNFRKQERESVKQKNIGGKRFGVNTAVGRRLSKAAQAGSTAREWTQGRPSDWAGNLRGIQSRTEKTLGEEALKDENLANKNGDVEFNRAAFNLGKNDYNISDFKKELASKKYHVNSEEELHGKDRLRFDNDVADARKAYKDHGGAAQYAFMALGSTDKNFFRKDGDAAGESNMRMMQMALDYGKGDTNLENRAQMMMRRTKPELELEKRARFQPAHL
jgi:hypothetical protein